MKGATSRSFADALSLQKKSSSKTTTERPGYLFVANSKMFV